MIPPVDVVVPWPIDPLVAKQRAIIEQQPKEDDGRRKNQPGKNLNADDD